LEPIIEQCHPLYPFGRANHSFPQNRSPEKRIQGTVSDTGIGIAPDEIPRIFEEFYRTETAKSLKETGTGLGLPIVQLLLSLYGGTIEIDSTPGKGSSFRFSLPEFARDAGAKP